MLVATLRKKHGTNIVVVARAEVLFAPGADVPNFRRRLIARIKEAASQLAPANGDTGRWAGRRTMRPHPGPVTLKNSFRGKTERTSSPLTIRGGITSLAPYAHFVDQGTGIYGTGGPYRAKILPPWSEGSGSLYEHTWNPGGHGAVAPVMIQGQRGQKFMDAALKAGMQSMRLRSYQKPGEGASPRGISEGIADTIAGFNGSSGRPPALETWREWRDDHYGKKDRLLGGDTPRERPQRRAKPRLGPAKPTAEDREYGSNYMKHKASKQASEDRRKAAAKAQAEREIAKALGRERREAEREAEREARNAAAEKMRKAERLQTLEAKAIRYADDLRGKKGNSDVRVRSSTANTAVRVYWVDKGGRERNETFR